jgi:hypothetical protein
LGCNDYLYCCSSYGFATILSVAASFSWRLKTSIVHINLFDNSQVDGPCVTKCIKSKAKRRKTPA